MIAEGSIHIRSVSKFFFYRDQLRVPALVDFDLTIGDAEFLSIVGPSGCGKSTLLNIIAGLKPYFPPDKGDVVVGGQKVTGPGPDRGMVFQEYALFPWMTVRQNVELGLKLRGDPKPVRREVASRCLDVVGLQGFEGHYPHHLSGGMKQRAAVARALALNPRVLLMDEPFAAVDAQTRMTLQEELTRVWEQEKRTVVFITHSVQEAVFLSDRVIVMSSRPGTIKDDLEIKLPRPRLWNELNSDGEFVRLQNHILDLIRRT